MSLLLFVRAPGQEQVGVTLDCDATVADLMAEYRRLGRAVSSISYAGSVLQPQMKLADTGVSNQGTVDIISDALAGAAMKPRKASDIGSRILLAPGFEEGVWTMRVNDEEHPSGVGSWSAVCLSDKPIEQGRGSWTVKIDQFNCEDPHFNGDSLCAGIVSQKAMDIRGGITPLGFERSLTTEDSGGVGVLTVPVGEDAGKWSQKGAPALGQEAHFEYDADGATLTYSIPSRGETFKWVEVPPPVWPMVGFTYADKLVTVRLGAAPSSK